MRNLLTTVLTACFFVGGLYGHEVVYNPVPMTLTYGGQDGTISVVLVGDEPSPLCEVTASAAPQSSDLVSVVPVSPQPAPSVTLNVHVLRPPHGSSESVRVSGRWNSAGIPSPPCLKGVSDVIAVIVTVNATATGPGPIVSSVVNGASFLPGIQENCWVTIAGSNLSTTTRTWKAHTEIINGKLPTSLDGVSVKIDGKPASMYFISPGQIDVLAPGDDNLGPVEVKVTTAKGTSNPTFTQLQMYSPAFFKFGEQGGKYITALIALAGGNVDYLGPVGLFGNKRASRPAKPGEVILLYGTGFGPTNPPVPSGMVFTGAAKITDKITVTIGGVTAKVQFAGVTGVGLYQLNVVVPPLSDGDQKVIATIGGLSSQDNSFIAVKN
jgi:uncharacterized protein (TIGR03437 family)